MSLSMPIENILWQPRIRIFNLNRSYIKKLRVPRFPLINCSFSVLFFRFLFLIIKLFFRLKLPKLLLFNSLHSSHHLLLLGSGEIEINPGPMKSSRLNFCH